MFCKNQKAAAALNKQMTEGRIKKEYLAATDRSPENKQGTLIDYLLKDGRKNLSAVVSEKTKGAKKAILSYRIEDEIKDDRTSSGKRCIVRISLETGRHHQIRVQMASAGMPLLGDRKYYPSDKSGYPLALCSCKLNFIHPYNGKRMDFQVKPKGEAFQL